MCDLYGGLGERGACSDSRSTVSYGLTSSLARFCSAPLQSHCKCLNGGKGCLSGSVLQQTKILLFIIHLKSSFLGKDTLRGGIVKPKISRFQNPKTVYKSFDL